MRSSVEPTQSRIPAAPLAALNLSRLLGGGVRGNELLTAITGALSIALLAVLGVTILQIRSMLWVHLFVGLLLIGPLALKLASTGYRFARYYTHSAPYRLRGAPPAALRLIAPIVVVSTVVVMTSGVALLLAGPQSRSALLPLHKVSFIVWAAFTGLHVLGHLREMGPALRTDWGGGARLASAPGGRSGRALALASTVVLGGVIAILLIPEFAPWLHAHFHHHH
jgi:hypothetical protein